MLCALVFVKECKQEKAPRNRFILCVAAKANILLSLHSIFCRCCCCTFHFIRLLYSRHITLFVAECVNTHCSSAPYKINNFISLADLFVCPLCHRFHLNLNIFLRYFSLFVQLHCPMHHGVPWMYIIVSGCCRFAGAEYGVDGRIIIETRTQNILCAVCYALCAVQNPANSIERK